VRRPNILIITTDQQRWDTMPCFGNPSVIAPNLNALATRSACFSHCFIQNPLCMPSRVSSLTGQYPSTLGITHMGVPVPEGLTTIATIFSRYGYRTANLGKLHFLPHANRDHRELHPAYDFDQVEISDEPGVYDDTYRAWVKRQDPNQLDRLSVGLPPATHTWYTTMGLPDMVVHPKGQEPRQDFDGPVPFAGDDRLTHSAFVGDRTVEFLRSQSSEEPFLCVAAFYSPHAPWVVPRKFLDLYRPELLSDDPKIARAKHGYYAMISEVDQYVGEILAALDQNGHADNTVVVFTSDHGEWLGDSGRWGKGYPADDAVSRIPFLILVPGDGRTGQLDTFVELVDMLPTLLDVAGLPIPPHIQGKSLGDLLLRGGTDEHRDSALTEFTDWKALRTTDYRYVIHADGTEHLWRATEDAIDANDLVGDPAYGAVIAEHRHRLLQRILQAEMPLPKTWPY
jgi:arylsulfatase A-like enzyme